MKRKLIILSILVVFVMCAVQISNVGAKSGPLQPTGGWIWWLFPDSQKIYVIAENIVGRGGPIPYGLYLYVTRSTQINIGDEPGSFADLEEGQYITFSYYVDGSDLYATWIAVKPSEKMMCPPGEYPCDDDPFP